MGDDVFQLYELVNPYWVASSNDLKKNSNFRIAENTFIDVDTEELNDILSSRGHAQVDEDDKDEINIQDCDGDRTNQLTKKKIILINLHNTNM
jgi:regulator of replication initiation timing